MSLELRLGFVQGRPTFHSELAEYAVSVLQSPIKIVKNKENPLLTFVEDDRKFTKLKDILDAANNYATRKAGRKYSCEDTQLRLLVYVRGELGERATAMVKNHLIGSCGECIEQLNLELQMNAEPSKPSRKYRLEDN